MAYYSELFASLPIEDIARQLGTDPETARSAVNTAIPALLGGLQANTADPAGAASLLGALSQHSPELLEGGANLADVDTADGEKIVRNIFGDKSPQVVNQLGAAQGIGSSLFQKLLPILAPIVLAYLTKKITGAGSSGGAAPSQGGGGLGDLLGGILGGGAAEEEPAPTTPGRTPSGRTSGTTAGVPAGVDINAILKDLLGGGKR